MQNKVKYELEFAIHASPQMLYQYISSPSGLSEWYADNVNLKEEIYTFIWSDTEEKAKLLRKKLDESIKFRWLGSGNDTYFEMKIVVDEITEDVSLVIVDFASHEDLEESKMLWENQVAELKHVLGSV
ncbi:START-like domain-containing protein [Capnocytophaga cynodegmi]|uniref:START-like domain-containing protein n=1 Tax=Capnocytophaga cynodegmi TaxID=28189 RepID=UPI00385CB273